MIIKDKKYVQSITITYVQKDNHAGPRVLLCSSRKILSNNTSGIHLCTKGACFTIVATDFEVLSTMPLLHASRFTLPLGHHPFELLVEKINRPLSSICFDCSATFELDTF